MRSKFAIFLVILSLFIVTVVAASDGIIKHHDVDGVVVVDSLELSDDVEFARYAGCNMIDNGSFELAGVDSDWVLSSANGAELVYTATALPPTSWMTPVPDGSHAVWLAGDNNDVDSVCQTLTIPTSTTGLISLSYGIIMDDDSNPSGDKLTFTIDGNLFGSVDPAPYACTNCSVAWAPFSFDIVAAGLSANYLDGNQHTICIEGVNDGNDKATSFFVDDVAVIVDIDPANCNTSVLAVAYDSADTTQSSSALYIWVVTALAMMTMVACWHAQFSEE